MIERTPQQQAANLIMATGHLLIGSSGRQTDLDDNLAVIVGPSIHPRQFAPLDQLGSQFAPEHHLHVLSRGL